jgi:hypothetical protein
LQAATKPSAKTSSISKQINKIGENIRNALSESIIVIARRYTGKVTYKNPKNRNMNKTC